MDNRVDGQREAGRKDGGLLRPLAQPAVVGSLMQPIPNQSVTERIVQRITDALIDGQLQPGQKIPTETELSESMHVSRNSVREAIKALVAMGVLEIRRAEGTFVCERFSDKMLSPLIYGLILEGGGSSKVIELRKTFDMGILQLAMEKAKEEDVIAMKMALADLRRALDSGAGADAILDADIAFHKVLENTVRNPLVEMISVIIERLTRPTRVGAVTQFLEREEREDMFLLHANLVQIIERKDATAIAGCMDEHYKYWRTELN